MTQSPFQSELDRAAALHRDGDLAAAEAIYRQILSRDPSQPDALHLLGLVAHAVGRNDVATQLIKQALAIQPGNFGAWSNLAEITRKMGNYDDAKQFVRNALQINPNHAPAHHNLAAILEEEYDLDGAIEHYRAAIQAWPEFSNPYIGLGSTLRMRGQFEESLAAHQKGVELAPNNAEAHARMALVMLVLGQLEEGLEEYEWRFRDAKFSPLKDDLPQPRWDGADPAGKTILLRAEQGAGDTIQFIRYAPMIVQRGGKVIVQCPPELTPLLSRSMPEIRFLAPGEPVPHFDAHCPIMSLPRAFKTRVDSIPAPVPYLKTEPAKVQAWKKECTSGAFNVGLVWAGRPDHVHDKIRSTTLATFAPLAQIPGLRFFSLQKGERAIDAKNPPAGMELLDVGDRLHDFSDTAALIQALDLLVAVDTSVVHLAGALARPVWTLLPAMPDWRWFLNRSDSPWYPTMKLFRQPILGDWASVIDSVASDLKKMIHRRDAETAE